MTILRSFGKINNSFFPSLKDRMKLFELKTRRVGVVTAVQEVMKHVVGDKPVMIMMVGLPASGKSTFIKKMEEELQKLGKDMLTTASTDDMIDEAAKALGITYTQAYHQVDREAIEKKFKEMIKNSVDSKQSFLIDRTHITKGNRQPHLQTATSDFIKIAVAFEIDPKVQMARLKKRAEETGKHIPDEVIEKMRNEYEPPSHEEGFDEIIFIS